MNPSIARLRRLLVQLHPSSLAARRGRTEAQLVDEVAARVGADVAQVEGTRPHPAEPG